MVIDGLRGRRTSPVLDRRPRGEAYESTPAEGAEPAGRVGLGGREVVVAERIQETADAVTLILQDPTGAPFDFTPGAFFTVILSLDDGEGCVEEVRRAYSASSSALEPGRLALTCKRVEGGRGSTYLNQSAAVGDSLRILGPAGAFTLTPQPEATRRLVLVGGGSGITPLMSMIRTILVAEPGSELALIYGNRTPESIIFRDGLAALAKAYPGRLHLRHVVETVEPGWGGGVGRLDRQGLAPEIAALPWPHDDVDGWYVCGPEPMLAAARELLVELGVGPERLHEERFSAPQRRAATPTRGEVAAPVTIRRRDRPDAPSAVVIVQAGATLLEAATAAGQELPFSCAVGGCGACRVRVLEGEVVMDEPNCLTAEERAQGFALACCGAPLGPCSIEVG